jgi:hypothetical protein
MRAPAIALIFIGIVLLAGGCSGKASGEKADLMAEAEFLVREARWADAIPVLKDHLILHPEDSGAHFYLGRCWLNAPEFNGREGPWLVLAEGELQLALQLFEKQGGVSTIERFNDRYFELICHVERAKIYLKQLQFLAGSNGVIRGRTAEGIMENLRQAVADARAVNPDAAEVRSLEQLLRSLQIPVDAPQPPPPQDREDQQSSPPDGALVAGAAAEAGS